MPTAMRSSPPAALSPGDETTSCVTSPFPKRVVAVPKTRAKRVGGASKVKLYSGTNVNRSGRASTSRTLKVNVTASASEAIVAAAVLPHA